MPKLCKGGDELAWRAFGPAAGDLVVCCHGAGYDGSTFNAIAESVASRGLRVLLLDNRGSGASTDGDGLVATLGPAAFVDDLVAVLEHVDARPAIVLGHSLGGWTALGAALARPDAVAGVVLVATPAGIFTPEVAEFWDGFVERLRDGAPPDALAALERLSSAAPDLDEVAAVALRCPVHFVIGTDDPVYPPDVLRSAAAAMPGAVVTEVAAGHLVHVDAPDAVVDAIVG